MTTDNTTTVEPDQPGLLGLLALGELTLHLRLSAVLADAPDPAFALRAATASSAHLERARRFCELTTSAELETWRPVVDTLLGVPAADWLEGMVSAQVVGGALADLADLLPQASGAPESAGPADVVRTYVEDDPALAGRLSLFGRRTFGRVLISGRQIVARLPETHASPVRAYFDAAGDTFATRMTSMALKG
ncbi:MAG: hypothetical protein Q4G51_17055 [Dermatophilus congolensis]|nr:hypothetical protein [Dermatophilus congolensis]